MASAMRIGMFCYRTGKSMSILAGDVVAYGRSSTLNSRSNLQSSFKVRADMTRHGRAYGSSSIGNGQDSQDQNQVGDESPRLDGATRHSAPDSAPESLPRSLPSDPPSRSLQPDSLPPDSVPDYVCLLPKEFQEIFPLISGQERAQLLSEGQELYNALSSEEKIKLVAQGDQLRRMLMNRFGNGTISESAREKMERLIATERPSRTPYGFWNMDSGAEMDDIGADEPFLNDDMSALGHGELEQHREARQYARWIVWELPLLAQYAKPFELPQKHQNLRFRQTSYLGENHSGSRRAVVEFAVADMTDLTPVQIEKVIKILGKRYDPNTGIAKISSDTFPTMTQNKNHILDMIERLLAEGKDMTDDFADLPFDFRHRKPVKENLQFPSSWIRSQIEPAKT